MKKRLSVRLLAALLCMLLLIPCVRAEKAEIYFVAVDDAIPLTLSTASAPYASGGTIYAPYTVFNAAPGGVVPSYNASTQTLVLFRRGARLVFDLSDGTVTDEDKNSYTAATVYRGGVLYVPLDLCLSHFGLSAVTLTSLSGYSILRFTTGSEVYDNDLFVEKAENLIAYLAEQNAASQPSDPTQPNGPQTPPIEEEEPPHAEGTFCLAVMGVENMVQAAEALAEAEQRAAFFLTEAEIKAEPELVRALYTAGHVIGVTCAEDAEDAAAALRDANEALGRVLHRKSLFALLTAAQSEFCPGYCILVRPQEQPPVEEILTQSSAETTNLLLCGADTAETFRTLQSAGASLRLLRETSPLILNLTPAEEDGE